MRSFAIRPNCKTIWSRRLLNYLTGRISPRQWFDLPDDFDDEGGSGVRARRRPRGQPPSLANENPFPGFN
ncbi:hypothetical protein IV102_09925 [bacterium]|nr:hypothetical protein [bacterium]